MKKKGEFVREERRGGGGDDDGRKYGRSTVLKVSLIPHILLCSQSPFRFLIYRSFMSHNHT